MRYAWLALSLIIGCTTLDAEAPVYACRLVPHLSVSPSTITLLVDSIAEDSAHVTENCGVDVLDTVTVTWASTNPAKVTVASSGAQTATVTAVDTGTAYVRATYGLSKDSALVTVTTPSSAGPDTSGTVGDTIPLSGTVPAGQFAFWRSLDGPGEVVFTHDFFNASFEDGNANGEWSANGSGGILSGTHTYATDTLSHEGDWSWAAWNDPSITDANLRISAKLLNSGWDRQQAYYSADYWFPVGWTSGYDNVFQFKEDENGVYDPTWIVVATTSTFSIHDYKHAAIFPTTATVPKGQWVNITAYMKNGTTTGRLIVWVNGVVAFNRNNINTLGTAPSHLMWGVGNYASDGVGKTVFVDDTRIVDAVAHPDVSTTGATFSAPGTYHLVLTTSDGVTSHSDTTTVTIAP